MIYRILADVILFLHAGFVAFVVLGLLLIVAGSLLHWRWVRYFWFRMAHLLAIAIVVGQAWGGVLCPLTMLENHFRIKAGGATYPGGFIAYWVRRVLFYEAEPWVFTLCYTIFVCLVLATFVFNRPRWPCRRHPAR